MSYTTQVEFSEEDFESFKKKYKSSKEKGLQMFTFKGGQYVTVSANYLIEYLESKIKEE